MVTASGTGWGYLQGRPGRDTRRNPFQNLPGREFVIQLATLYGDLNVLHPFREGNGRAQRAFLANSAPTRDTP